MLADDFPYIHNDDVGSKPIGEIFGIPIYPWYPETAERRKAEDAKKRIEASRKVHSK